MHGWIEGGVCKRRLGFAFTRRTGKFYQINGNNNSRFVVFINSESGTKLRLTGMQSKG
jgi:hypothetical protein